MKTILPVHGGYVRFARSSPNAKARHPGESAAPIIGRPETGPGEVWSRDGNATSSKCLGRRCVKQERKRGGGALDSTCAAAYGFAFPVRTPCIKS